METIVVLDRAEEIAALFGEGFKLFLAGEQVITIKARGEKITMADGKLQFLMLHVEGGGEVLHEAMDKIFGVITSQLNGKTHVNGNHSALAAPVIEPVQPLPVPHQNGKAPKAAKNKLGEFPCRHCDRVLSSSAGRGKHESSTHPDQFQRKSSPAGALSCGHKGCEYTTNKPGWLENHYDRQHGGRRP